MTTLSNKNKTIEVDFATHIEKKKIITETDMYTVILPEVKCSSEEDAHFIMTKVTEYIGRLVKDMIKSEE